jgi:radical SAM superfamily enzyme YgiQ (UPF0313 family)
VRPVDEVIDEIRHLSGRLLAFLDDNLTARPQYAFELFRRMESFNKLWYSQASIKIAENEKLLRLAKKSGCGLLAIGFDSVSRSSLSSVSKSFYKPQFYKEAVRRIHEHGILVSGCFIFGFDFDDKDIFKRTVEFALEARLDFASFHILTPYPGAPIYYQLQSEGRITTRPMDWTLYDTRHVVFQPRQMTAEELRDGFHWAIREFYSASSIAKRLNHFGPLSAYLPVNLVFNLIYRSQIPTKSLPELSYGETT